LQNTLQFVRKEGKGPKISEAFFLQSFVLVFPASFGKVENQSNYATVL